MPYLIITAFLWATVFTVIELFIAGKVDNIFAALIRVAFAALVFLPFLNWKTPNSIKLKMIALGAAQIGGMYIFFFQSFNYLSGATVALLMAFTPIYVTLIYDAFHRQFKAKYLLTALLAVAGVCIIESKGNMGSTNFLVGLIFSQCANICFAFGQAAYKRLNEIQPVKQKEVFGFFFIGAALAISVAFLFFGDTTKTSLGLPQLLALIWLGTVTTGIGYFLWNKGGTMVDSGTLGIMNNAVTPIGVTINILVTHKQIDLFTFLVGLAVLFFALILHVKVIAKNG